MQTRWEPYSILFSQRLVLLTMLVIFCLTHSVTLLQYQSTLVMSCMNAKAGLNYYIYTVHVSQDLFSVCYKLVRHMQNTWSIFIECNIFSCVLDKGTVTAKCLFNVHYVPLLPLVAPLKKSWKKHIEGVSSLINLDWFLHMSEGNLPQIKKSSKQIMQNAIVWNTVGIEGQHRRGRSITG